jgi:hypothetical protein
MPEAVDELTDAEKAYAKKMCGLSDANIPFNEAFFVNMNIQQIKYLLSIVDMQDAQSSYSYALYVKRLRDLAIQKKIDSTFCR